MVFRYYKVLILPVALASVSVLSKVARLIGRQKQRPYERLVLLLGLWWFFDMALVWVSPRPYEQYYLPLNASAAMLGCYAIDIYRDIRQASVYHKGLWNGIGAVAVVVMIAMAVPIAIGVKVSPATGRPYGARNRGYIQRLDEIAAKKAAAILYPWEQVSDYVRSHSSPQDRIYVWGWIPGIYVRAQRFGASPIACTSEMHVYPPSVLAKVASDLIVAFEKIPPLFIVDTHHRHFPYDPPRNPLELWPSTQHGLIPPDPNTVKSYEQAYHQFLKNNQDKWPDEAERFLAMKPLRDYIMANYFPVQSFGDHVVFQYKKSGG